MSEMTSERGLSGRVRSVNGDEDPTLGMQAVDGEGELLDEPHG